MTALSAEADLSNSQNGINFTSIYLYVTDIWQLIPDKLIRRFRFTGEVPGFAKVPDRQVSSSACHEQILASTADLGEGCVKDLK